MWLWLDFCAWEVWVQIQTLESKIVWFWGGEEWAGHGSQFQALNKRRCCHTDSVLFWTGSRNAYGVSEYLGVSCCQRLTLHGQTLWRKPPSLDFRPSTCFLEDGSPVVIQLPFLITVIFQMIYLGWEVGSGRGLRSHCWFFKVKRKRPELEKETLEEVQPLRCFLFCHKFLHLASLVFGGGGCSREAFLCCMLEMVVVDMAGGLI